MESVRRIISGFVEKEKSVAVFNAGDLKEMCSTTMQRVAKTVDAYLGEIATYDELSISKFNGIANLMPKMARKVEDDLYRAIDIYLKAHPNLDEIEREKVYSVMDPLRLSYEVRVHASGSGPSSKGSSQDPGVLLLCIGEVNVGFSSEEWLMCWHVVREGEMIGEVG